MASILSTRRADNTRVIAEVLLSSDEMRQLQGEMNDVRLFTEHVAKIPSRVSLRGKNEATKYFLIPRQLRKNLAVHGKVSCYRLEPEGKSIFIYVLDPATGGRRQDIIAAPGG